MERSRTQVSGRTAFATHTGTRLRVFHRAEIEGRVFIHDDENLFNAALVNISAGGVFVRGLTSIPEGSLVRLVVKSANLESVVQATGTVVRVETGDRRGLAVEFTSISSKAREIIQNCVFERRMESSLKAA